MATHKFKSHSIDKNPIEAIRDLTASAVEPVVDNAVDELNKALMTDLWDQMLGTEIGKRNEEKTSGQMAEGQEIALGKKKTAESPKKEVKTHVEAALDYSSEIIHAERNVRQSENRQLNIKIEEILIELKKLTKSSKEMEVAFRDISIEDRPVSAGKYHLNFFEWVLSTIRTARLRVEDSANWANVFASKKGKKDYWSMFKKAGTSFGLSGERVVATQTG